MKETRWEGWAITKNGAIVLFDARHTIYWKRSIAKREAEEHGLRAFVIKKVKIVDAKGDEWVVVRRTGLSNDQKKRLALFDNRTSEFATWDENVLKSILEADDKILEGLWSDTEVKLILDGWENGKEAGEVKQYDPNSDTYVIRIDEVKPKDKDRLVKELNFAFSISP